MLRLPVSLVAVVSAAIALDHNVHSRCQMPQLILRLNAIVIPDSESVRTFVNCDVTKLCCDAALRLKGIQQNWSY